MRRACSPDGAEIIELSVNMTRVAANVLLRDARHHEAQLFQETLMSQARSHPLILIADDDSLLVMVLRRHLSATGAELASVSDGAAALAYIEQHAPDVVILDSLMPGMSGSEVLLRLKTLGLIGAMKIIVLTTLSQEEHVLSALRLGAADFVSKPFSPAELVLRVTRLLHARAA